MTKQLLALAVMIPLLGCGRNEEAPVFDKVEMERLLPLDAKGKTTLTDQKKTADLATFFPGMGRGKASDIAAGWKAAYRLRFIPAKGDPIKITVDSRGEAWSEGNGDWKAKPSLKEYLDSLFAKAKEKQAGATWSEEVNGLRGRLVRYPRPRVNGTEIIGVNLELRNVSTEPLAVAKDPGSVHVRLFGPDGTPVPGAGMPRSGPVPGPQWGILPRYCYRGSPCTITDSAFHAIRPRSLPCWTTATGP